MSVARRLAIIFNRQAIVLFIIGIQEMMYLSILLIRNNRAQINILNALKNIAFHIWIGFFQFAYELLDLHPLGDRGSIGTT